MKTSFTFFSLLFLLLCTNCTYTGSRADDQEISFNMLPSSAQDFLNLHFPNTKVKAVTSEHRASLQQYEVALKGGIDVQFDKHGTCTEVSCKKSAVPEDILPAPIQQQIRRLYPGQFVINYEHDSRVYEIILNDETELVFNRSYRLIDVD